MSATQTPTALPTPANDRYHAAKAGIAEAEQFFVQKETARLHSTTSREEAIEMALKAESWLQKSKVATKDKAIRIVVRDMWQETEAYKAFTALRDEASNERAVIKAVEAAQGAVDRAQVSLVEAAQDSVWDARGLLHEVADLRKATTLLTLWDKVRHAIEYHEPVAALEKVIESVTKDALSTHRQRALSRSTSVMSNLIEDIDNEATAEWLATANAVLGKW